MKRFIKPCLGVVAGLWIGVAHAELQLVHTQALSPVEEAKVLSLKEQAYQVLPSTFKASLSPITLRFSDSLPPKVLGRLKNLTTIELNRRYLTDAPAYFQTRTHGSVDQELLATLIHELAHLYDRRFSPSLLQRQCRVLHKTLRAALPERCWGQEARRFQISDDPRFLDIAGWPLRMGAHGARSENFYTGRSPDVYELTNAREFFAVNFEYFVLDKSYACRRPALFAYLNQHFNAYEPPDCPPLSYVNAGLDERMQALATLDPKRVYAVDYLLAEANQNWASRFGHSMLRLVICAPDRPLGPDCRLDISHHVVLSYRAFVNDLQLSSWQGLTGGYPSRLFILPLSQVIDEYTKVELRGLSSIPLNLTSHEREALVKQAVQTHWSYDGQYFFVSNNCAVETLNLLRAGTGHQALTSLETITPTGLLTLLNARGLAQTEVLADRAYATRMGYWFDSYRERYELMLGVLEKELGVGEMAVETWLEKTPRWRRQWFAKANTQALAALLLLEQAAFRKTLLLAQEELKRRYLSDEAAKVSDTLRQMIHQSSFLTKPSSVLGQGYGIAQPQDIEAQRASVERHYQALLDLSQGLEKEVEPLLSAERLQMLKAVEDNLAALSLALKQRVKPLH